MKQSKNFFNVFIQTIKDRLPVSIVYCVLVAIASPLLEYVNNLNVYYNSDVNYTLEEIKTLKIITGVTTMESSLTIVVMAFSAIIAFMSFSYLHKKRSMDFYGSMPVTRRTEFFARMLASIAVIVVPLIFVTVGSAVITGFTVTILPMLTLMAMLIVGVIANVTFIGFLSVCCGTTGLSVLSYIIISCVYPLGVLVFSLFPQGILPGLEDWSVTGIIFTLLSPVLAPFAVYDLAFDFKLAEFNTGLVVSDVAEYLIWWAVFIIGVNLLNAWLVKKRKSESAQAGFAFVLPRIVIKVVTAITAGFIAGIIFALIGGLGDASKITSVISFVLGYVFITFASHLLLHLMYHKGMSDFVKCLFLLIPEFIIGLSYYFIIMTGGFGFVTRIPDVNNVEKAVISFSDSQFMVDGKNINEKELTDGDDIKLAVGVHQKIVDTVEKKRTVFYGFDLIDDSDEYDTDTSYNITYTLKDGSTLTRSYDYSIVSTLSSDEDFEKLYKIMDNDAFLNIPDDYCASIDVDIEEYDGSNLYNPDYDNYYSFVNYENGNEDNDYFYSKEEKAELKKESEATLKLLKALKADYKEFGDISNTVEENNSISIYISYYNYSENNSFFESDSYEKTLTVDSRYTRTLELLNDSDFQKIGLEDYSSYE
jgi:ABC-type transport system involved in multi-copper enzyme maturation permease subunit